MRRVVRQILHGSLLLLWIVAMLFPVLAVVLAVREQVLLGDDTGSHVRIFLVQERDSRGVGLDWRRPARERPDCLESQVVYLMWRGEGENATFCSCYGRDGELTSNSTGRCPVTAAD
jgi:hypothetical protein